MAENRVISALESLNCAELDYDGWIRVGMALKAEGYDVSVWDRWSSLDPARYHQGECIRHWRSFRGSATPVTGATILKMAMDRGWKPPTDGSGPAAAKSGGRGAAELILYLRTLFRPEEYVAYVTGSARKAKNGKWLPVGGPYHRTAGELIASLERRPDDVSATVGKWKEEAGAWIRFNPLDGKGRCDENVTAFRYALVESDEMPVEEQIALYRELELPVVALVDSGKRSAHAIVRVDAENMEDYGKRVDFLYRFLSDHGLYVDPQNRNPSRLSRMPGVTRGGTPQKLLGVNLGRKNWADWMEFVKTVADGLPSMCPLAEYAEKPPELSEEIIDGVLRRGHKMLVSGCSKAGKSYLLMELSIAVAEGGDWLGFPCRRGRVLYVNLEIDPASCVNRFLKIYDALKRRPEHMENIIIWNLRGHAAPLKELTPKLVRRVRDLGLDMIIIDPLYKVIAGDENSASDMAVFCNQFDIICSETGCCVVYCHHHSKGAQGPRRAMDRASGSGVFARDPDAQLDVIELELTEEVKKQKPGATAWRLECSLREFRNFPPVDFWFEFPVHRVDGGQLLKDMPTQGSSDAGQGKRARNAQRVDEVFRAAFRILSLEGKDVTVSDMAEYLHLSERTIRERVARLKDEFRLDKSRISRA